ncbi:MAG TPA: hypothetical protein VLA19_11835 [Herpetosiphonaceae bacterium]|nr:hypothetical protein [Herpetosiphonaceae bacterium]
MSLGEFWQTVWTVAGAIVLTVGGAGAIIIGISSWLGRIWADRLQQQVSAKYAHELEGLKSRYAVELEHLRDQFAERHQALDSTMQVLNSRFASSHDRVIVSQESVWNEVLAIRNFVTPYLFHYAILHPREYIGVSSKKVKLAFQEITSADFLDQTLQAFATGRIEKIRPFIGEDLWFLYFAYCQVALRLALNVVQAVEAGQLQAWDRDSAGKPDPLREVLETIFKDSQLTVLIDSSPYGAPQRILGAMEDRILSEMNKWLFGTRLADITLAERQRIAALLPSVERGRAATL